MTFAVALFRPSFLETYILILVLKLGYLCRCLWILCGTKRIARDWRRESHVQPQVQVPAAYSTRLSPRERGDLSGSLPLRFDIISTVSSLFLLRLRTSTYDKYPARIP
jgi:hypothetical protein